MSIDPARGAASSRPGSSAVTESARRRAPLVPPRAMSTGRGLDLTVEFIAAIALYGGVGWLADSWLGTTPWLLVAGCVLGNACGLYLLYRHGLDEPSRTKSHDPPDADQRTAA